MKIILILSLTILFTLNSWAQPKSKEAYKTKTLVIEQIEEHLFKHISNFEIPNSGIYPCNGVIYISDGEAVVLDTPVGNQASRDLIHWIEEEQGLQIKGVIVNHFHEDCLGGLQIFHANNIPSYANEHTLTLAREHKKTVPQNGFSDSFHLEVGKAEVISRFVGEAHTPDNIISYIPKVNALYGGCMVKEMKAGKGNLNDANPAQWPQTIEEIKQLYPGVKTVIPGHGKQGGKELLDYTIRLFTKEIKNHP